MKKTYDTNNEVLWLKEQLEILRGLVKEKKSRLHDRFEEDELEWYEVRGVA